MKKEYREAGVMPEYVESALAAYAPFLRRLLFNRGIETADAAEHFLHPSLARDVHDPFLLTDMEVAVERIERAVADGERIVIYSDYDHDGIPAAVILADYFDFRGHTNYNIYIPHRNTEGFGLNTDAVAKLHEQGTQLMITLDLGITALDEVAHARALGMDVIVTDHHTPLATLPDAVAVVNPKRDNAYPFAELCGSGVAWKLVCALVAGSGYNTEATLDLVSIATLSDMVPLRGENRALVQAGLKVLRGTTRPGLVELFRITRLKQEQVSEDDVVFMLTPRINAASRIDRPEVALDLLVARDSDLARDKARELEQANKDRKGKMGSMLKSAKGKLARRETLPEVLVVGDTGWDAGLLGLVAQRLVEEYQRPVFVWGRGKAKTIKGSCRGDGATDVFALMHALPDDILLEAGGHVHAGGFETNEAGCAQLEQALNDAYATGAGALSEAREQTHIEATIDLQDVGWELYGHIEACAPFGMDNPKPVLRCMRGTLAGVEQFGKHGEHLKLLLDDTHAHRHEAIAFFTTPSAFSGILKLGEPVELLATVEKSTFRGFPELRLRIVDVV